MGLSVFGFQQSALWGWGNPVIWASIAVGVVLLVVFYFVERRTEAPLINVRIFENRTFLVENIILGIAMMAFIPVFFFAAIYGQIALAEKATQSSLLILYFFIGFVICAQIGGRMLDRIGAKRPVVLGVIIFAGASALCGATPRGSAAEAWLVAFRALQGLGGAIMFPAAILGIAMMAFIPVFFFAAIYGQIALAEKATQSSLLILYFFIGFVVCAQIGGRMLDRIGAKRPVVLGCALAAVGFGLWAGKVTDLHAGAQILYIVIAGAGMGLERRRTCMSAPR